MLFISITNIIAAYRQYTTTTTTTTINESITCIYQFIIGIEFIGSSSSSNDILLLYIVLHTNPIQCIWIRHLILLSEATAVCTEEGGTQIRLYIELLQEGGDKRVRLFIELLHGAGGKLSPTFVYQNPSFFLPPSEKAVVIVIFYY